MAINMAELLKKVTGKTASGAHEAHGDAAEKAGQRLRPAFKPFVVLSNEARSRDANDREFTRRQDLIRQMSTDLAKMLRCAVSDALRAGLTLDVDCSTGGTGNLDLPASITSTYWIGIDCVKQSDAGATFELHGRYTGEGIEVLGRDRPQDQHIGFTISLSNREGQARLRLDETGLIHDHAELDLPEDISMNCLQILADGVRTYGYWADIIESAQVHSSLQLAG